jgi:uncharacterized protein YsxB (DUF464 family)
MIKVVYHREHNRLSVTGHANSGEPGHDLVCASVSTLVYTLAANVEALTDMGKVREPTIDLEAGGAVIWCKPIRRYSAVVRLIFGSICAGFALLAETYPDYISYEVRE